MTIKKNTSTKHLALAKDNVKSRKPTVKSLYPYQANVIESLNKIYAQFPDKRAFLQMPTGTGKTFTALSFCIQQLKATEAKTVVWVCHQTLLKDQSAQDFKEDFENQGGVVKLRVKASKGEKISEIQEGQLSNIKFIFKTWQTFRNQINDIKADMLVIDEAHYGSSLTDGQVHSGSHTSFKKIIHKAKIPRHLYVSATLQDLNPELFPDMIQAGQVKRERMALYTAREAINHNPPQMSEVEFVAFHSADTLTLKRNDTEVEDVIDSEDSKGLAKKAKEKRVNIKDKRSVHVLRKAVTRTLVEAYMKEELGNGKLGAPPTIVFCRSISEKGDPNSIKSVLKEIRNAATALYGPDFDTGRSFVASVHGKSEDKSKILKDFKNGDIKILLVCRMAREGFNYPDLQVAIDLCPSLSNKRQIVQKIGRICRYLPGKKARYYYPDTIENYLVVRGTKHVASEEYQDKLTQQILETMTEKNEEVARLSADTLANAAVKVALLDTSDSLEADPSIEAVYRGTTVVEHSEDVFLQGQGAKKSYITRVGCIISDAANVSKRSERTYLSQIIQRKTGPQIEITADDVVFMATEWKDLTENPARKGRRKVA
jgi:superfamily II DNA or RNA helicase